MRFMPWQARADLLVDLIAALQLGLVELAGEAGEGPLLALDVRRRLAGRRQPAPARSQPAMPAAAARRALQRGHRHVVAPPLSASRALRRRPPACRPAALAQHRLGDRARQLRRRLDDADDRHDHQEVDEIVGREDARPEHVGALGRLGAEIAERQAGDDEQPEEPLVDRPVLGRAHAAGVEPGHEDQDDDRARTWRSRRRAWRGSRAGSRRTAGSTTPARCAAASTSGLASM